MSRDDRYYITFIASPYHAHSQNPQLEITRMCVKRIVSVFFTDRDAVNDLAIITTVMNGKEMTLVHEFLAENGMTRSALLYLDSGVLKTVYCGLDEIEDYIKERKDLK